VNLALPEGSRVIRVRLTEMLRDTKEIRTQLVLDAIDEVLASGATGVILHSEMKEN
jgi:hypothetical protein